MGKKTDKCEKGTKNEIDELFDAKKSLPRKVEPTKEKPAAYEKDGLGDTRGTRTKARSLTKDGLPVYSAEEMRIGRGGGTAQCPFDCECCY